MVTVAVTMMDEYEKRKKREEFVKTLRPTERGVLADMIMRSLRGSWRRPRARTHFLEAIAKTGDVEYYDAEELQSKVNTYFRKIGRGDSDGRYWRHSYETVEIDHTVVGESKFREFASRIPDDSTWDDYRINKVFEE